MRKIHGWVIVASGGEKKKIIVYSHGIFVFRRQAREVCKKLPWTGKAVRKIEVIEPAPRKKTTFEPVMMICPKAKTCQTRCPVSSSKPHMHDENCDRSTIKCPRCVEIR